MARKRTSSREPELVLARASVNLDGLRAGQLAWVNPAEPWIADKLDHGFLVREKPQPGEVPPRNPSDSVS